jgi:hypothetical protein
MVKALLEFGEMQLLSPRARRFRSIHFKIRRTEAGVTSDACQGPTGDHHGLSEPAMLSRQCWQNRQARRAHRVNVSRTARMVLQFDAQIADVAVRARYRSDTRIVSSALACVTVLGSVTIRGADSPIYSCVTPYFASFR